MDTNLNIKEFEGLMETVNREGKDKLMEYIRSSDFYTAPASTRFHLSCPGGLLQHSLNVWHCLRRKRKNVTWRNVLENVSDETLIIISLLHDLCKTNFYSIELRWRKDANNKWEQYETYGVDDKVPYGHGEKSAMMVEQFIKLTGPERFAIRWHMGFTEPKELYQQVNQAMEKYPLVLALHEADQEASIMMEDEKDNKQQPELDEVEKKEWQEPAMEESEAADFQDAESIQ